MKFKSGIVETVRTYSGVKYVYEYDYSDLPSSKGEWLRGSEPTKRISMNEKILQDTFLFIYLFF
jgi:hypothetical protein